MIIIKYYFKYYILKDSKRTYKILQIIVTLTIILKFKDSEIFY